MLFHTQCSDLLLRQGDGLVGLSYEAGDATDVADQMPGVICQDHLNEDVTGEHLALHFLHDTRLSDLGDGLHRDLHLQDHVGHIAVHHGLFNGRLHRIFIAGIGVDDIPFCVISHAPLLSA